eukprot:COSAG05_NODE_636_length_8175_cov_51.220530_2_plen_73_part_00
MPQATAVQAELCQWNEFSIRLEHGLIERVSHAAGAVHDLHQIEEVLYLYHNTAELDDLLVSSSIRISMQIKH